MTSMASSNVFAGVRDERQQVVVDVARHDAGVLAGPACARQRLLERVRPHDPGVVTDGCTRNLSVRESSGPNMLVMGAKETSGVGETRCSASLSYVCSRACP